MMEVSCQVYEGSIQQTCSKENHITKNDNIY